VPRARPPADYDGTPHRYALRRGTPLWRVHPHAYGAWEFNARLSDPLWDGARFDAAEADKYPYLYAGLSAVTALAETLLRDVASDERGYRVVPNDKARRRSISQLTLTQDLDLVSTWGPSAKMTGWSAAQVPTTRRPGTGRTGCAARRLGRTASSGTPSATAAASRSCCSATGSPATSGMTTRRPSHARSRG